MTKPKSSAWFIFDGNSQSLGSAQMDHMAGKLTDGKLLLAVANGLQQLSAGCREAFQETYERIERLHQKIDRLEAKIGSVPKK
jgi:hypothetical protein